MNDLSIIELYFARDEEAIKQTDIKYGKLCHRVAYNILNNNEDSEECVNDTYIGVWNAIPPTRPNNFMAFVWEEVVLSVTKRKNYNPTTTRYYSAGDFATFSATKILTKEITGRKSVSKSLFGI